MLQTCCIVDVKTCFAAGVKDLLLVLEACRITGIINACVITTSIHVRDKFCAAFSALWV